MCIIFQCCPQCGLQPPLCARILPHGRASRRDVLYVSNEENGIVWIFHAWNRFSIYFEIYMRKFKMCCLKITRHDCMMVTKYFCCSTRYNRPVARPAATRFRRIFISWIPTSCQTEYVYLSDKMAVNTNSALLTTFLKYLWKKIILTYLTYSATRSDERRTY